MTIVRSPRLQRDFTVISNAVCLDSRLSMRALGLLVRLLCRPDNWRTNSETLAREFDVGREQMRATLNELVEAGYMALNKHQDAAGHWSSHWVVFDEPQAVQPKSGQPEPGNPYVGGLGAIPRTDLTRTKNKPPNPQGEQVPEGFAKFWETWPDSARKAGKKTCLDKWVKKGLEQKAGQIVQHVEMMKQTRMWKDGFEPSPQTYINQQRWDDGVPVKTIQDQKFAGVI